MSTQHAQKAQSSHTGASLRRETAVKLGRLAELEDRPKAAILDRLVTEALETEERRRAAQREAELQREAS